MGKGVTERDNVDGRGERRMMEGKVGGQRRRKRIMDGRKGRKEQWRRERHDRGTVKLIM